MRALGLYCLLEGIPRPEGQVAALRAGIVWHEPQEASADSAEAAEVAAIRVVAAKALCDWALVRCQFAAHVILLPKSSCLWHGVAQVKESSRYSYVHTT